MTLRSRHGNAREYGVGPVLEVLPADELPAPTLAPGHGQARGERDAQGRFRPGARTAQSAGGRALKHRTRLAAQLGIEDFAEAEGFAPYIHAAEDLARAEMAHLAARVGGGHVGPDVGAIVMTGAWQQAASRYLFARAVQRGGDTELFEAASRLGNAGRQSFLAAYELAARTAKANPPAPAPLLFVEAQPDAQEPES